MGRILVSRSLLLLSLATAVTLILTSPKQASAQSYSYRRAITIDHTKVANTDQSNFPVLVSGTYSYLATVANGGKVQNSSGYDIIFTSDAAGSTKLDHEIESYNAGTGAVSFWVRIPTLSHTTGAIIYMQYGNSAVTTSQENKTGVWQAGYQSVYHFGSTMGADSASAGYGLSQTGTVGSVTGKIGGGVSFNGSAGNYLSHSSVSAFPSGTSAVTLEAWVQSSGFPNGEVAGYGSNSNTGARAAIYGDGNGTIMLEFGSLAVTGSYPNDSQWHHVVGVYSGGSSAEIYLDGAQLGSTTSLGTPAITTTELKVGGIPTVTFCCAFTGSVDEVRVFTGALSTDWIATEYHTQNSPSTFYAVSQELVNGVNVIPATASLRPGQTQQFTLIVLGLSGTGVTWSMSQTGIGSVNSAGLYTAPSTFTAPQTVTLTATSTADTTKTASATVTLLPAFDYRRTIVIDHTKVPNTDQSNFPVLISGTYSYLATTANGGRLQNANGYDVIFSSDANGNTKLDHEIESYNPTTGAVNFWVRVPTVSHTSDTVIYMQYSSPNVSTSLENKPGVWDSNFQAVWHLNGSTLSAADSTSQGHNGTINGATATTGEIGGAANFSGSAQYIDIGSMGARPTKGTISMWVNAPSLTSYPNSFTTGTLSGSACGNAAIRFELNASGVLGATTGADNATCNSNISGPAFTTAFSANSWHLVTVTWDSAANTETSYYDGSSAQSIGNTFWPANFNAVKIGVGFDSTRYWSGKIDEVRMSSSVRSHDWIAAEFHNQNSPATFYSLGGENVVGISVTPVAAFLYGGQTKQFTATVTDSTNTSVTWTISPSGVGSLSSSGLYTAPSTVSTPQAVTITATSVADASKAASSTVTLNPPISVSVSPSSPVLIPSQGQQFTATLTNTPNGAVTWSISPSGAGSISAAGVYAAPPIISSSQSVTITATSVVDTSKSGTATVTLSPAATAFMYRRAITIDHTKVPNTDQADFPVLISGIYSYLATAANGGKVQSVSGYDIVFTLDAGGTTKLDHEIETYDPVTGTVRFWVRIPALSHTADTVIYAQYGDSSISGSLENKSGVWKSNYNGVWHLPNGTTLNTADSTANGNNGINNGAAATAGQIDGAASFNGSNQAVAIPRMGRFSNAASVTLSAWVNPSNSSGVQKIISLSGSAGFNGPQNLWTFLVNLNATNGRFVAETGRATVSPDDATDTTAFTPGQWSYVSGTFDTSKVTLYVNGVKKATTLYNTADNGNPNFLGWSIGKYVENGTSQQWWNGAIDEVRVASAARTADWISAEYSNQSSPSTFYSVGSENTVSVTVSPATSALYGGQTQQFAVGTINAPNPAVTWSISPSGTGSVSSSGQYTAPPSISTQQTVTVTATSIQDTTKSASATATLYPPASVTVTPSSPTLFLSQTQQFSATVANAPTQAVIWSITPATAGNITSSGLYTAPAMISAGETITVTATSIADSTKTGTVTIALGQESQAYSYRRAITIDHTKVAHTDQSNFPVLVSGTYSYLATVANGGKVQNANGYDIIFTSDAAGSTTLDHEIESYNASTGAVNFWVRIPTLSHTADTIIYMQYGNNAVTTSQENKVGVWRAGYQSVYHFGSSVGADSGRAGYGLSQTGSVGSVTGKIGGGVSFNGSAGNYLSHSSVSAFPSGTSAVTLEAWVQSSGYPNQEILAYGSNANTGARIGFGAGGNGAFWLEFENLAIGGAGYPNDSQWHHWVGVYSGGSSAQIYLDGTQVGSTTSLGTPAITTTELKVGGVPTVTSCCAFTGSVDEVRVVTGALSADWIATEYNTESSPSTFYSTGIENAPFISLLSPSRGAAGTSVTISGTGFGSSAGTVSFNGHTATTSSWSNTSVVASVPTAAGMGNVVVTNNGISSNGVIFEAPFISGLSPSNGLAGTSVTISGSGFGTSTGSVTFAGVSASITSWSDTSIVVTVPAGALSGYVVVVASTIPSNQVSFNVQEQVVNGLVTYSYDTLGRLVGVVASSGDAAQYNYDAVGNILSITRTTNAQPTVLSFSPASGPVGTQVTISGSNYSTTASSDTVKFNGTTATVSSASATQLVVTVPSGATTGTVAVTAPAGTGTSASSFTVTSSSGKPTISSFTPQIAAGGASVTISGTNFDTTPANNHLIVNTASAAVPSSVSSTSMAFSVPSAVGSGHIYLGNATGTVTSSGDLFVPPSGFSAAQVIYTGRAALGSTTTVAIGSSGIGMLLFDGAAGKNVSISSSSATFSSCSFQIYDPYGNPLGSTASCSASSFLDAQTLPSTGTYTVLVVPGSSVTGSVALTLNDSTNAFTPVTSGGSGVTVTTIVPGQNGKVTFSAVGGQQASVQFTSNTFGSVAVSLVAPDGTAVISTTSSSSSFSLPAVTLASTGLYTILIDPPGTTTGSIHVGLTLSGGTTAVPSRQSGSTLDTSASLSTNLVGLFLMNEGSGTTDKNLVDGQFANFSGTVLPQWYVSDSTVLFQGGASLNSYLDAGADLNFDQLTPGKMTVVAKVFVRTVAAGGVAEKNDNDADSGFVFGIDGTGALRLTVEKVLADMQVGSAAGAVLSGQWVQVAFTWDGTTGTAAAAHLYLNGVEQSKAISNDGSGTIGYANATGQPFRVGNAGFDFPGSLDGRVAYVAVYKGRILSTTEMGQLDTQLPIH